MNEVQNFIGCCWFEIIGTVTINLLNLLAFGISNCLFLLLYLWSFLIFICISVWVWTCIVSVIERTHNIHCINQVCACVVSTEFGHALCWWLSLDMHCIVSIECACVDWVWICIVSVIEFGHAMHWYFNNIWLLVCRWLISCISVLGQSEYVCLMCSLWALYFLKFSCWMVLKTA